MSIWKPHQREMSLDDVFSGEVGQQCCLIHVNDGARFFRLFYCVTPLLGNHPLILEEFVPKPDHIFDLERRLQALENELAQTLLHCSTDDPMIADLKRRLLHLRDELHRFHHEAVQQRRLH